VVYCRTVKGRVASTTGPVVPTLGKRVETMGESSLLADDRTPSAAVGQHVASVPPGLVTAEAPTVATRRCVAYLRVSTAGQAMRDDTEEGYSLPAQRDGIL